jgi:competence protein ComEC
VIVPFLGIILIGGILIIVLSVSTVLPNFLVTSYGAIISWMNDFIRFVSHQEAFLFSGISFSLGMLLSSYLIIVFGFRFFERRKAVRLIPFLGSILIFQGVLFVEKYQSQTQNEFLVFHQSRVSISGIRQGSHLQILDSIASRRSIESYAVGENVTVDSIDNRSHYLNCQNQDILFVDSLGVYTVKGLQSPIVVLQHSPRINLYRLIDELHPQQIVADGSNYKSLVRLWEQTCNEMNVPFWNTGKSGAFVLE